MTRRTVIATAAATLLIGGGAWASDADGLFGWSNMDPNDSLFFIDPGPPPAATFIGGEDDAGVYIAEIEWVNGIIYGSDTGDNTRLHVIDPATGLTIDTVIMTFPPEGNVITSMEFVDGTLYAGLTTEGSGEGPTFLSTIDLVTGVITTIGPTGFGSAFGGLAWDGTTMYGISAGGEDAELFTVDLSTGAATSHGLVTIEGNTFGATALEFGLDGVLYSLPNRVDDLAGHLLSIDPSEAEATDLGDTGQEGLVALTAPLPEVCESFDGLPDPTYDFVIGFEPFRALFTGHAFAGVPAQPFLAYSPPQAWLTPPSFGTGVIFFETPVEYVSFYARAHPWATFPTYIFAYRGHRLAGFDLLWPDQGWREIEFTGGITAVTTTNSDWGLFSAIDDLCYLPQTDGAAAVGNDQSTFKIE
jgi:hypothetical protein